MLRVRQYAKYVLLSMGQYAEYMSVCTVCAGRMSICLYAEYVFENENENIYWIQYLTIFLYIYTISIMWIQATRLPVTVDQADFRYTNNVSIAQWIVKYIKSPDGHFNL